MINCLRELKTEVRKMVYYPSMPLVMKTEAKQQLCSSNSDVQMYTNGVNVSQQSQQQHLLQSHQNASGSAGTTLLLPQGQNFLHNIKLEAQQQQQQQQFHQHSNSLLIEQNGNNSVTSSSITISTTANANGNNHHSQQNSSHATGNKIQLKCEQCNMIFGSKSAHTSHMKSHMKQQQQDNNYAINSLPISITNKNNAGAANNITNGNTNNSPTISTTSTGSDPYQCNVCQKTFAVPARLIRHYRTHTGERPFECEFCHKTFSVKENLQVHRRIHTKERPYKCDVCDRAFEHSGKLHRHMRIHTGERPHKCSVCDKTFIQSGQLVIHMRTHTGEKPYKCPVEGCGKGFTCSKQLKVHSRTHTGEKPYHCDICFRDFGYNHVLKLHRVQHYGSKCYKCTICDETFKSKKEMEAHIKGHANEIPDDDETESQHPQQQNQSQQQQQRQHSPHRQELQQYQSLPSSSSSSPSSSISSSTTSSLQPQNMKIHQEINSNSTSSSSLSSSLSRFNNRELISETEKVAAATLVNNLSASSAIASNCNNVNIPMETENNEVEDNEEISPNSMSNMSGGGNDSSIYNELYQRFEHNGVSFSIQSSSRGSINPALLAAASIASRRVEEASNNMSKPRLLEISVSAPISNSSRGIERAQEQEGNILMNSSVDSELRDHQLNEYYHKYPNMSAANNISFQQHHQNRHLSPSPVNVPEYNTNMNSQNGSLDVSSRVRTYFNPGPVPEYRSSLRSSNDIVRQVEAAIAGAEPLLTPPRSSSTESPERSSSPESDSMMMADRDVMTLPLRKRKLYLKDNQSTKDVPPVTAMRMSSVIQFAKAS